MGPAAARGGGRLLACLLALYRVRSCSVTEWSSVTCQADGPMVLAVDVNVKKMV